MHSTGDCGSCVLRSSSSSSSSSSSKIALDYSIAKIFEYSNYMRTLCSNFETTYRSVLKSYKLVRALEIPHELSHHCNTLIIVSVQMRQLLTYYFALRRGAKYCDKRVCVWICLSVRSHISNKYVRTSRYVLSVTVARSLSGNNVIHYVLPVLWMTSFFHY